MEFISIGGLVPGLSTEDIRSGISQPRNKNLANIFHRLHLIESYGTGIRKIFNLYEGYREQPRIEVTQNTFKIILPNMNKSSKRNTIQMLSNQEIEILDYIKMNGSITDNEISSLLKIGKTRVYIITKEMKEKKLIQSIGRGATKKYVL